MTGIRGEFVTKHMLQYMQETGTSLEEFQWEEYIAYLEEKLSYKEAQELDKAHS